MDSVSYKHTRLFNRNKRAPSLCIYDEVHASTQVQLRYSGRVPACWQCLCKLHLDRHMKVTHLSTNPDHMKVLMLCNEMRVLCLQEGETPLHLAAKLALQAIVEQLVAKGALVNVLTKVR